jgi:hypothetical protein
MPPEPVEPLAPANAKNKTLLQCSSFIAPACHALQPGRAGKRRWFAITGHTERIGCLRGPGMSAAAQPENVTRRVRFSFFFGSRKPTPSRHAPIWTRRLSSSTCPRYGSSHGPGTCELGSAWPARLVCAPQSHR